MPVFYVHFRYLMKLFNQSINHFQHHNSRTIRATERAYMVDWQPLLFLLFLPQLLDGILLVCTKHSERWHFAGETLGSNQCTPKLGAFCWQYALPGFEGNISPSARLQKYISRAEISICLSARLTEIFHKKSSFCRSNHYVFGIIGKLFEIVREWCSFHVASSNIFDIFYILWLAWIFLIFLYF